MNDFKFKLLKLAQSLEGKHGPLAFFAVVVRSESLGLWDLLVTAPWADEKGAKAIDEIVKVMEGIFTPEERTEFSRVECLSMNSLKSNHLALSIGSLHSKNVDDIRDCTWNNKGVHLDLNRVRLDRALVVISDPKLEVELTSASSAK